MAKRTDDPAVKLFDSLLERQEHIQFLTSCTGPFSIPFKSPSTHRLPGVLILIASEFAEEVAAIWAGGRIAEYLVASDRVRHVWHCWLASPRSKVCRPLLGDEQLREHLTSRKAKDLLQEAYGACPPGLISTLGKCGSRARQRAFYPALVHALARQDFGSKHIKHASHLSDAAVISIAALPTKHQSKPFFAKLHSSCFDDESLAQACWTMSRLNELGQPGIAGHVSQSVAPIKALQKAISLLPFPKPPWPGTSTLRPLMSLQALELAGDRLQNCLRTKSVEYAVNVVRGNCYHYEWVGDEPGILTAAPIAPLGWMIENGYGRANDPIGPATWAQISTGLSTWADLAPLQTTSDGCVCSDRFFNYHLF